MTEATSGRALSAYSFSDDNMTYAMCLNGCSARGYMYGGIEYSRGESILSNHYPPAHGRMLLRRRLQHRLGRRARQRLL